MTRREIEDRIVQLKGRRGPQGLVGHAPVWCLRRRSYALVGGVRVGSVKRYTLLTAQAARLMGWEFVPWWQVGVPGALGVSDDGIVSEVIRTWSAPQERHIGRRIELVYPYQRRFVQRDEELTHLKPKRPLLAYACMAMGGWHGNHPKTPMEYRLEKDYFRKGMALLVEIWIRRAGLLTDEDCSRIYKSLYPYHVRGQIHSARHFIRQFFERNAEVREYFMSKLTEKLEEAGLGLGDGLTMLKAAFRTAKKREDSKQMKEIAQYVIRQHQSEARDLSEPTMLSGHLEALYAKRVTLAPGQLEPAVTEEVEIITDAEI